MNHEIQKPNNIQKQPKKELEIDYEPFDPRAELKNLRHGDKETRTEKLENYKTELIRQKEGIAEIQNDLEKQIRENPDLPQEELMKTVLNKAPEYRLSENQLKLFKETLNKYEKTHQAIREARKKYPDDKELFKACFGKEPEGAIEVIESPITLYFRCRDLKDYAWIYNDKCSTPEKQKLTKSDIQRASMTSGFSVSGCLIPSLKNTIAVEKPKEETGVPSSIKQIFQHEEQHTIYRLFSNFELKTYIDIVNKIFTELFDKKEIQDKIAKEFQDKKPPKLLVSYLKSIRRGFENSAKSEILAFLKEDSPFLDIVGHLLRPWAEGGCYDYCEKNKEQLDKTLKEKLMPEIFDKNKKTIRNIFEQILVGEYQKEIINSIDAVKELEQMGKSRDEIIHLLITEPLSRWDKLVKRIQETKK